MVAGVLELHRYARHRDVETLRDSRDGIVDIPGATAGVKDGNRILAWSQGSDEVKGCNQVLMILRSACGRGFRIYLGSIEDEARPDEFIAQSPDDSARGRGCGIHFHRRGRTLHIGAFSMVRWRSASDALSVPLRSAHWPTRESL